MTSSQHGPYVLGYTHATMAGTTGGETARWSKSLKAGLSSACRLQLRSRWANPQGGQPSKVGLVIGTKS